MEAPPVILNIIVNGSALEIPNGTTVDGLLRQLEIETHMVAVEQNLEIVPKTEYTRRSLNSGDRIEVVHFVGGG